MPAKFAGSSTEGVADHGRRESRRIFSDFIYISPVVSATTSDKKFQKIRYKKFVQPVSDRQTDGWTHEHSEIINIDSFTSVTTVQ